MHPIGVLLREVVLDSASPSPIGRVSAIEGVQFLRDLRIFGAPIPLVAELAG